MRLVHIARRVGSSSREHYLAVLKHPQRQCFGSILILLSTTTPTNGRHRSILRSWHLRFERCRCQDESYQNARLPHMRSIRFELGRSFCLRESDRSRRGQCGGRLRRWHDRRPKGAVTVGYVGRRLVSLSGPTAGWKRPSLQPNHRFPGIDGYLSGGYGGASPVSSAVGKRASAR